MVPRHEGTHLHVLLQSRAESKFLGLVLQFRKKRGRDVVMQQQFGPSPTHLPRVLECAPECAFHRAVHLRVRQHDLRILPAELQGGRDQAVGHDPEELLAGLRRTGEGDGIDIGMVRQGLTDGSTGARDHVHHAGRKARRRGELAELKRAERRESRGLEDHSVACGEGGGDPARGEQERIVPRGDMGRDPERLPEGVVQPRAGYRDGLPLNFICQTCIIFEQLVHIRDVALRLAEGLADVQGFET